MINFYISLFKDDEWFMDVPCRRYPQEFEIMAAINEHEADYAVVEKRYERLPFA